MCEFKANVLPTGTFAPGVAPETWVWGYVPGTECPTTTRNTYLGPVVVEAPSDTSAYHSYVVLAPRPGQGTQTFEIEATR